MGNESLRLTNGITTKGLKESGHNNRKAFNSLCKKDSCTRNISHKKQSATIWKLKPGWWSAPLVQEEKNQRKGNLWLVVIIIMIDIL